MFTLIDLPYELGALESVISARTLEFHHGKHLQGYVDNLNKFIPGTRYEGMTLEQILSDPELAPGPIFNNAGQILNHNLYFTQFCPPHSRTERESAPSGALKAQIEAQWGSFDAFRQDFVAKGASLFGSGWVWLQADASGALSIGQYPGADNPLVHGLTPLLTFDVWEHAYYLDYQNRRAAHLEALWGIVDWKEVEKRYRLA